MVRKLAVLSMLGIFVISLAACNTTEGAGEDVEDAGQAVQNAAE